jgi:hypothetical protein
MFKKIFILFFIALLIFSGYFFFKKQKEILTDVSKNIQELEIKSLCYLHSVKTSRGFFDEAWLKLNLIGEKVSGEYRNLPAEKDSKIGNFSGTVSALNQESMSRTADVMWNSLAEGMNVTEELLIDFVDGSASVGFGEMIDRGDGVYVYKDKSKMTYRTDLNQIACEDLEEKLIVEKYVRDNIKTIATDNAVLGGSWYVLNVHVVPSVNSGEVLYEDGHIQSSASFKYEFDVGTDKVSVNNFEVKK